MGIIPGLAAMQQQLKASRGSFAPIGPQMGPSATQYQPAPSSVPSAGSASASMPPSFSPPGGYPLPGGFQPPGGFPPAGFPPRPQAAPMQPVMNSVQAQINAAMGPGKNQVVFEIPQEKASVVLGRGGATLNAIKAYSKAECFVEQKTPDENKARVTVVGTDRQIEKCKQTVFAVVDGTMSLATLCSLAGVPMPSGRDEPEPSPGGGGGSRGAAGGYSAMPPPGGMGGGMPGMPENQAMQQNLNDYYARWWSTYANMQQQDKIAQKQASAQHQASAADAIAFDVEALKRLADKAANAPDEPPAAPMSYPIELPRVSYTPPPSLQAASLPPSGGMDDLADRASAEVRALLGGFGGGSSSPPSASGAQAGLGAPMQLQPRRAPDITLKGFLRPTSEPPKAKKDDDSVKAMLERLDGNVQQTKQALAVGDMRAQQMAAMGVFEAQGTFREDTRSQRDYEFDSLMQRVQSAQSQDEVESTAREVLIRFTSFTPQQAVELLQKMDQGHAPGLSNFQNGDFQAELSRLVIPGLKEFSSTQFTALLSTFASWSSEARMDKKKRAGRFGEMLKSFFNSASLEMSSRLMTFAPHELNCCLAAFVSVGFSEHKFFASVGRAALARHTSFAPVQLTALLAILSEMRLVHHDLFNAAAIFLSARAKELRPVDIVRVLRSFSKCGMQNQGLCKAVSDEVVTRYREKLGPAFKAEDMCEIGWALCVLQHYNEALFRIMFKALEKSPMITTDALIQLYEIHLTLDCEYKEAYSRYYIGQDMVHALYDHYRDNRKDERRCSERQRNDVASVLKSLVDGSVHVNHRTSTGWLVDVAALRKRSSTDGFVHVDLDSSVTVVRSLDQDEASAQALVVEGPVALRRRILMKQGLRLVTVRESDWRDLDDSKDKRRYLRSLLSNLGDVLE